MPEKIPAFMRSTLVVNAVTERKKICVYLRSFADKKNLSDLCVFAPLRLGLFIRSNTQTQRIQLDETFGVFLVVSAGVVFEGGDVLVEQ